MKHLYKENDLVELLEDCPLGSRVRKGDQVEIVECRERSVRVYDAKRTTTWTVNYSHIKLIEERNTFKVGDWVVITRSGYGTNPRDEGKVCRIVRTNCKDSGFASYSHEIDRDKVGNHDRFLSPKALRHATPEEIASAEHKRFFVGDVIEILKNRAEAAAVTKGDRFTVKLVHENQLDITVFDDARRINWGFSYTSGSFRYVPPTEAKPEQTPKENKPKPQTKTEEKMSNTSTGFQVLIPEQAIQERVDKLVMYKLRHEKLHGILTDVVSVQKEEIRKKITSDVIDTIKQEFIVDKERIIESFLESKRTEIYLDKKLGAVVADPQAHKELPKLISFLKLFHQALICGPTGSGKSTLAKQAAEAMTLRYGSFSCNMEASKSELVGFANLNGYVTSQFLDFYENGGVFLIDEL